jgi:hypothetical protein
LPAIIWRDNHPNKRSRITILIVARTSPRLSRYMLTDHRGMRRTSYSFRHFYISQQIIAGVEVFLLAKNTGTSSAMIERFYADVKLERMSKELRPDWRGRTEG